MPKSSVQSGRTRSKVLSNGRLGVPVEHRGSKLKIPILRPELPDFDTFATSVREIWDSGTLTNWGPFVTRFEEIAAAYLAAPYARAVVSADIGLTLAIAALQLPEGSVALLPSFTFNSTVNAVIWNRLRPVFCDVDPDSFCIDPREVEARMTPEVSLVIGTHVFGSPCDADALRAAAGARPILFDAAQAYGARYRGRMVGGLGDIEVFSFSVTKLVQSAEGGLVTTRSAALAERFEYLRGYGFSGDYESHYVGMNGKMSELHAALACLTLPTVEDAIMRRTAIMARYRRNLAGISGIRFQRVDNLDRSVYKDAAIVFENGRDQVEAALTDEGIQTRRYFRPAHTMRAYQSYAGDALPVTESLARQVLCMPIFNTMDNADVDRVCGIIRAALPLPG
jgi:dTDP-4-amino-4,6-dideoxygalactose transaminase